MEYYFYVLRSEINGDLYKGITKDLKQRIKEHNSGKNQSTKSDRPWKLIYYELCDNRIEARGKEKYYKSGIGREKLKALVNK